MNKTIVNNGLNCNKVKSQTTLFFKKVNIESFMTMCKFKKIEGSVLGVAYDSNLGFKVFEFPLSFIDGKPFDKNRPKAKS